MLTSPQAFVPDSVQSAAVIIVQPLLALEMGQRDKEEGKGEAAIEEGRMRAAVLSLNPTPLGDKQPAFSLI